VTGRPARKPFAAWFCDARPNYGAPLIGTNKICVVPTDVVEDIILVDDASTNGTLSLAERLGIFTVAHDRNKGYGVNQKTCYRAALERGADIVIMLHPDYQYTPKLLLPMASHQGSLTSFWGLEFLG
jgi:glycosyltransferase involved in cell wall biosynthesis